MNKICTSIDQSKKLVELGIDIKTADMRYHTISHHNPYPCDEIVYTVEFGKASGIDIPCWSLSALIDALPIGIEAHNQTDGCKVYYYVELYMKHIGKEIYLSTERYESLVDACYEMIVKLKELKLL